MATIAYVIGRGNPFWMLVAMIVIGIGYRRYAYRLIRRSGQERPPRWRWL